MTKKGRQLFREK